MRVFDTSSGKVLHEFVGQPTKVATVSFDPDTFSGIGGGFSGQLQLLRRIDTTGMDRFARRATLRQADNDVLLGHINPVTALANHKKSEVIVSGDLAGQIRLWNWPAPEPVELTTHPESITAMTVDTPRHRCATAGGEVMVHDLQTGQTVHRLATRLHLVSCLAFDDSGDLLAAGDQSGQVEIWHLPSKSSVEFFRALTERLLALSFHPTGSAIFVSSESPGARLLRLTSTASDRPKPLSLIGANETLVGFDVSSDGTTFVGLLSNGEIRVGTTTPTARVKTTVVGGPNLDLVGVSSNGEFVCAGSKKGLTRVWSTNPVTLVSEFELKLDQPVTIPAGAGLLAIARHQDRLQLFPAARLTSHQGEELESTELAIDESYLHLDDRGSLELQTASKKLSLETDSTDRITTMDRGSTLLAAANSEGQVLIWDGRDGSFLGRSASTESPVTAVLGSPDGSQIAFATADGQVRIRSANDLTNSDFDQVPSKDRDFRVIARGDAVARIGPSSVDIWNAKSRKHQGSIAYHGKPEAVVVSSDGRSILHGDSEGVLHVTRLSSEAQLQHRVKLNMSAIVGASLVENDSEIISLAANGSLHRSSIDRLPSKQLEFTTEQFTCVAIASGGQDVLLGQSDGQLVRFSLKSGKPTGTIESGGIQIRAVGWVGSEEAVIQTDNGELRLCPLDDRPSTLVEGRISGRLLQVVRRGNKSSLLVSSAGEVAELSTRNDGAPPILKIIAQGIDGGRAAIPGNGDQFIFIGDTGKVLLRSLSTPNELSELAQAAPEAPIAVTPDGQFGAFGTNDGQIQLVDLKSKKLGDRIFLGVSTPLLAIQFMPDAKRIVATSQGTVGVWTIKGALLESRLWEAGDSPELYTHSSGFSLAFQQRKVTSVELCTSLVAQLPATDFTQCSTSAKGDRVFAATASGEVLCFEVGTREVLWRTSVDVGEIRGLRSSGSGDRVAVFGVAGVEVLDKGGVAVDSPLESENIQWMSPVSSESTLFCGTRNGVLVCDETNWSVIERLVNSDWVGASGSGIAVRRDGSLMTRSSTSLNRVVQLPKSRVVGLHRAPEQNLIAINEAGSVFRFDWSAKRPIETLIESSSLEKVGIRVTASGDDGKLLAIARSNSIDCWDLESRKRLFSSPLTALPAKVAVSASNVAIGLQDSTLVVYEREGATTSEAKLPSKVMALFPREQRFVAVTERGELFQSRAIAAKSAQQYLVGEKVIELSETGLHRLEGDGKQVDTYKTSTANQRFLGSIGEQRFATFGQDRTLSVFQANDVAAVTSIQLPDRTSQFRLAPSGDFVGTALDERTLAIFDLASGTKVEDVKLSEDRTVGFGFTATGDLLSASSTGRVNTQAVGLRARWSPATTSEKTVAVSGTRLGDTMATLGKNGTVWTWNRGNSQLSTTDRFDGDDGWEFAVVSSDGMRGAAAKRATDGDGSILRLWNQPGTASGETLSVDGAVRAIALNSDSGSLAIATSERQILICDLGSERLVEVFDAPMDISQLAFPFRNVVVLGGVGGEVQIRYVHSRLLINAHDSGVTGLAFGPNKKLIVSAGETDGVRMWSAVDGATRGQLVSPEGVISRLVFSPQEDWVAGASLSGALFVWQIDRSPPKSPVDPWKTLQHPAPVNDAYVLDGDNVVTACDDGVIRVWNLKTATESTHLIGHSSAVMQVSLDPTSKQIFSCDRDGNVKKWPSINTLASSSAGVAEVKEAANQSIDGLSDSPLDDDQVASLSSPRDAIFLVPRREFRGGENLPDAKGDGNSMEERGSAKIQTSWASKSAKTLELIESLTDDLRRARDKSARDAIRDQLKVAIKQASLEDFMRCEDPALRLVPQGTGGGREESATLEIPNGDKIKTPLKMKLRASIKTDYEFYKDTFLPVHLAVTSNGESIIAMQAGTARPMSSADLNPADADADEEGDDVRPAEEATELDISERLGVVRVFDVETRVPLRSWTDIGDRGIARIKLNPAEDRVVAFPGGQGFELNTGNSVLFRRARVMAISPDSKTIAVGYGCQLGESRDGVELFDAESSKSLGKHLPLFESFVTALSYSRDGKKLYAAVREWKRHRLFSLDLDTKTEPTIMGDFPHRTPWNDPEAEIGIKRIEVSYDSPDVYTFGQYSQQNFRLLAWSGPKSRIIKQDQWPFVDDNEQSLFAIRGSKNVGLVSGGVLEVIDRITGASLASLDLRLHHNGTAHLALGDSGRWMATGGDSGDVSLWDLANISGPYKYRPHISHVVGLGMSADARLLATAGEGNVITLWDVTGLESIPKFAEEIRKKPSRRKPTKPAE